MVQKENQSSLLVKRFCELILQAQLRNREEIDTKLELRDTRVISKPKKLGAGGISQRRTRRCSWCKQREKTRNNQAKQRQFDELIRTSMLDGGFVNKRLTRQC